MIHGGACHSPCFSVGQPGLAVKNDSTTTRRPRNLRTDGWQRTRRAALEALIAELVAGFVDLPADSSDSKIRSSLERLLEFFRLDRVAIWEFTPDGSELVLLHSRTTPNTPPPPLAAKTAEFEWSISKLRRGEPVCIRSLDDVPKSAAQIRASMQKQGIRSWMALPLRSTGEVLGSLAFVSTSRVVRWDERLALRLQIVADIFGTALARQRAERAWRRTEAMETSVLNSLQSRVVVLDRQGAVIAVNRSWTEFADRNGGSPSKFGVGAHFTAPCESCARIAGHPVEAARQGIQEVIDGVRASFLLEYDCPDRGAARCWLMTVHPLAIPEGGAVILHQDVTSEKRAQAELRESQQCLKSVADELPVVMWLRDANSDAIYVNKAGLGITGWRAEDFTLPNWLAAIHPDDFRRIFGKFTSAMAARQKVTLEYRYRHASGQYRWILATSVPRFLPDGTFEGYVGIGMDMQDLKEAEEARHAIAGRLLRAQEEERSRVARELHDDIAQRLTLLTIKLRELEQKVAEPAAHDQIADARKMARQLSLDVAHLSHNLHSSYLENLGLGEAVRGLCTECASLHRLEIDCRIGHLPDTVDKDVALALFRVLQEALRNVVRHSRATEVQVELSADAGDILLLVTDNGIGFDVSAGRRAQGLGLMSMKERLQLLGGDLRIISESSKGARLQGSVPVRHAAGHSKGQAMGTDMLNAVA